MNQEGSDLGIVAYSSTLLLEIKFEFIYKRDVSFLIGGLKRIACKVKVDIDERNSGYFIPLMCLYRTWTKYFLLGDNFIRCNMSGSWYFTPQPI